MDNFTSGKMLYYINETKQYALSIFNDAENICREFAEAYANNNYGRIVMVASGTSNNSCVTAKHFLQRVLKKPVDIYSSYDYATYNTLFMDNDLVIAVTQEGESTNTIKAINKANEQGLDTWVVTEYLNNSCTRAAKHKVTIACDREFFGAKTKGYVCTVLTLYMMALEAGKRSGSITEEEYACFRKSCEKTLNNIDKIIAEAEEFIAANHEDLIGCEKAYVLGSGPNIGVAIEGALKSYETVRYPYDGMELEEFLHGPMMAMRPASYCFMIISKNKDYERTCAIFRSLANGNDHVYAIGEVEGFDGPKVFKGSFVDEPYMNVFEFIIPLQLVAYRTFTGKGLDVSDHDFPDMDMSVTKAKPVEV